MSEQQKKQNCIEGGTDLPRLFAVLCPDSKDYFLATEEEAFHPELRSKITAKLIPQDERFVQYMPTDDTITWSEDYIEQVVEVVRIAESELAKEQVSIDLVPGAAVPADSQIVLSNLETHINDVRKAMVKFPETAKTAGADSKALVDDSIKYAELEYRTQYLDGYYANHIVTLDVFQNRLLVFQVGFGGGLIFNIPLASTSLSITDGIKKAGLVAALFLEVIILIGRLLGIKGNAKKAGDAIQEALKNSKVMKAFLAFIERVISGAGDLAKAVSELIKVLYHQDVLGTVLIAFLSGAFTILGIIWLIGKLLSKLVPGLGWAVTAAEILLWVAGVTTKIEKLRE